MDILLRAEYCNLWRGGRITLRFGGLRFVFAYVFEVLKELMRRLRRERNCYWNVYLGVTLVANP